ncbi:unnamed protein product [Rhizoctonia solani]|uniref:FBD domain-containing protein n=1 Tax=Rhizoctonia solani TaxID=456999 RepID=A0A8H3A4F8_9AGAM|nr:unnamed protein product [Rhizoctonia solani]
MTSSGTIPLEIKNACYSLAPSTQRFRLDNSEAEGKGVSDLLSYFLRHTEPSLLRELCLIDHAGSSSIEPLEFKDSCRRHPYPGWTRFEPLLLSTRSVDKRLRHIEVLWLRNIFFPWSCHAYIGLTDLRLVVDGDSDSNNIHMSQLVGILSSCPGLRIFRCNLGVSTYNAQPTVSQVSLKELEVVNLYLMDSKQCTLLLAHILPGEKPLELSLSIPEDGERFPGRFLQAPILAFFNRSRVTKLFLHKDRNDTWNDGKMIRLSLAMLLSQLPAGISTLGLNRLQVCHGTEELTSVPMQLDTVYMCSCSVDRATLQTLARVCPLRKLMLNHIPHWYEPAGREHVREEVVDLAPIASCSWIPPERRT